MTHVMRIARAWDRFLDDWRTLVFLLSLLALVAMTGFGRPAVTEPPAVAIVPVTDPVDAWLGNGGAARGDLLLAQSVAEPAVTVELTVEGLRFSARPDGEATAQRVLAMSLASYEAARIDLRQGLDARLDVVPELAAFYELRRGDESPQTASPVPLDTVPITLAPIWQSTPIDERLDRLDEVIDDLFWQTVAAAR